MADASRSFVDMEELMRAAEGRIADALGCEAACITSGAAAGLAIAAAACVAGGRPADVLRLPDTTGLPDEVLVLKAHRILYDQAVLLSGARFREIGVTSASDIDQVLAAIGSRTAMFLFVAEAAELRGSLPLADIAQMLAVSRVPLVVDAAAELPPLSMLASLRQSGADLIVLSGGKEMRGPQSSGVILGRIDLIEACRANSFPRYSIGRAMKVDKETVAGLVTAVELFAARDERAVQDRRERIVGELVRDISRSSFADARRGFPSEAGAQPAGIPRAFIRPHSGTAQEVHDRLRAGDPAVFSSVSGDELVLNPQCLEDDEVQPLIRLVLGALHDGRD